MRPNTSQWVSVVMRKAEPLILEHFGDSHLLASDMEYGCGAFGCVAPCRTPGLALKVTIDGSETLLAESNVTHPALPKYEKPCVQMRFGSSAKANVWLIWRDDFDGQELGIFKQQKADAIGRPSSNFPGGLDAFNRAYRRFRDQVGRGHEHLAEATQKAMHINSIFFEKTGVWGPSVAIADRMLRKSRELAPSFRAKPQEASYWQFASDSEGEELAMLFLAHKWHLQRAAEDPDTSPVAQAAQVALANGLMLCDFGSDNLVMTDTGLRMRDCGFCLPLTRRQFGRWEDLGFDQRVWFDWHARKAAFDTILRAP